MRTIELAEGEYYHVFNRGVEKRNIFSDAEDLERFLESIVEFNVVQPIGSLFEHRFNKKSQSKHKSKQSLGSLTPEKGRLVELICYCLNPNHFHLLLKQSNEGGIQKFMQKVGTGYTNYFNEKNRRSGALFQGTYKAVHIESNEQLLHTSVYVNLNNKLGSLTPKLSASSWSEYLAKTGRVVCNKEIILGQFKTVRQYEKFATEALTMIVEKKEEEKEMQWLLGS